MKNTLNRSMVTLCAMVALMVTTLFLVSCTGKDTKQEVADVASSWPTGPVTVVCPWAVGGVADIVNRKTASYGVEYLGEPVLATNELGAGGNVALTNYLKQKPNSEVLILGAENAFSIAPNVDGSEALKFAYEDFEPVINLFSAVLIMTADARLNITNLEELQAYGKEHKLTIAVNGPAGTEAFLAKALFKELDIDLELVSYNGANLALDAAAKGETNLAISHQSQAKGSVEAGILNPVVVFDKSNVDNEVFGHVKGVGDYGYKGYFRNRCFLLARKGTDPAVIDAIREEYAKILQEPEVLELYKSLMIEIEPLEAESIDKHISDVVQIVKENL